MKITHELVVPTTELSDEERARLAKRMDDYLLAIICPPQPAPTTLDMRKQPRCPECDRYRGGIINLCTKHMVS